MSARWLGTALAATIALASGAGVAREVRPTAAVKAQLAPSGALRAAINVGNVVLAKRGGAQGASGVSVDIANAVAKRLAVPVELIVYDTAGQVVEREKQDHWDIAFMGIDPVRGAEIAFTPPYVVIEGTYLVRAGSAFAHVADLDRPGVRIAVSRGSAYDLYLTRAIRQATLVRFDSSAMAIDHFGQGETDAAAGIREALVVGRKAVAGTRVLPDSFNRIEQAVAVPKSRATAARYLATLVEEMKASGFVRMALDRHGQPGAQVAPPSPSPRDAGLRRR